MQLSRSVSATFLVLVSLVTACGGSGDGEPTGRGGSSSGSGGATAGTAGSSGGASGSPAGTGGSTAGSGGASDGASGSGTGGDADGDLACGAVVCGNAQYCVFPCCGGAPPACFQAPQGGTCPAGSHGGCLGGFQCTPPAACCQFDPCVPPPPYCSDTAPVGCLTQQGRTCRLGCA